MRHLPTVNTKRDGIMNMKKSTKVIVLIAIAVLVCILSIVSATGIINRMFAAQYNSNGVSHLLVITMNEDQPRELVGKLDGHDIYIEGLDKEGTCFRSVDAGNVSLKEAFEGNLVSIEDWKDYARKIKKDGDTEILRFEDYEIAVTDKECVIRPRSFW